MAVFAKPLCHIPSLTRLWNTLCRLSDNRFSGGGQFAFELIDSLRQLLDHRRLFGNQSLKSFYLPVFGVPAAHCRDWPPWRNTTYGADVTLVAHS